MILTTILIVLGNYKKFCPDRSLGLCGYMCADMHRLISTQYPVLIGKLKWLIVTETEFATPVYHRKLKRKHLDRICEEKE